MSNFYTVEQLMLDRTVWNAVQEALKDPRFAEMDWTWKMAKVMAAYATTQMLPLHLENRKPPVFGFYCDILMSLAEQQEEYAAAQGWVGLGIDRPDDLLESICVAWTESKFESE